MEEKKKINWLLILQGWAMLWVVIGHAFLGEAGKGPEWENALFHFAYSFHMPLFMLVSGWLFYATRLKINDLVIVCGGGKWKYVQIVKDKALRLLLPGLFFSIVAFVIKLVFQGEVSSQVSLSFQYIAHAYLYPNDNPLRELWFIVTLFWFFLLTPFWQILLRKKWIMWFFLIVLAVLHFYHPLTDFLCISWAFFYVIWFYLGLLISKEDIVDKVFARQPWLALIVGIFIYCVKFMGQGQFFNFIGTFGGIVFSFAFALIADKYIPKLFFTFRNYTYQIFLMGIFAQMFVKILFKHLSMPYVGAYILCILVGLYVPVFVSKVILNINWKPLSMCVGLKKKN